MSKNRDRISTEDRITSSDSLFYPPSSPNNWNIQFTFNKTHDRNTTCSYNITTGVWNREESVTVLFDEVERYTSAVCFHMSRKYVNHSAQRGSSKITRETTKQAHTGTYARQTKPNQTKLCAMSDLLGIHRQHNEETDPGWQEAQTVATAVSSSLRQTGCSSESRPQSCRSSQAAFCVSEEMHASREAS